MQDSPTSSTENVQSVANTVRATTASLMDDLQTDALHRQPLVTNDNTKSPTVAPSDDGNLTAGDDDADNADEDAPLSDITSLIEKKTPSNVSLDSYDRTKNPFFVN